MTDKMDQSSITGEGNTMLHPSSLVMTDRLGAGTTVGAFVHIQHGASIGDGCEICDHVYIDGGVVIGDRVTVKPGVQLWNGLKIEDEVFIGPNATFVNDKFPRSGGGQSEPAETVIRRGASIGANATILSGLSVGMNAMVGAAAVVTRSVPPNAIVVGNPARIIGYVDTPATTHAVSASGATKPTAVDGVRVFELKHVGDMRGDLCVAEVEKDLPFPPKRVFFVYNVPDARVRGEHAHKVCEQFLIAVRGSVSVVADNGRQRQEYLLDQPWLGLHLPPGVWGIQYKYSEDAVLMVLASHEYDADDYIRDYDEFLRYVGS